MLSEMQRVRPEGQTGCFAQPQAACAGLM